VTGYALALNVGTWTKLASTAEPSIVPVTFTKLPTWTNYTGDYLQLRLITVVRGALPS
jgi:hypothetical protein